jgi:hypothetical protein
LRHDLFDARRQRLQMDMARDAGARSDPEAHLLDGLRTSVREGSRRWSDRRLKRLRRT